MAAPNELWQQYADWNQRINAVKAQGLNPAPALEVGSQDLKRIYAGGSPRSTQDIADQLSAAYSGNAVVTPPQPKTGILDIAGNAVKDVGSLIGGVIPAAVHEVTQIADPSDWQQLATGLFDPRATSAGKLLPTNPTIGDWARFDQQLPILGGLIPGLWTLGTSVKQKEQHPLISLLDVLPFVHAAGEAGGLIAEGATGKDAPVGSWQESLTHGKLAQAGIRASGIEDKVTSWLKDNPSVLGEWLPANKDIWRKWSQIGRSYSRSANAYLYKLAQSDSILPPDMDMEEASRIGSLASTYNSRYETPATTITPSTLSDLTSHWANGPSQLPPGDIQAFSRSNIGVVGEGPVVLSRSMAGDDAIPVRINRDDVMFTDQPGVVIANNIIPDITYDPKDISYIRKYRNWTESRAVRSLTHSRIRKTVTGDRADDPPLVRVPTGDGRPDAIFAADTGLGDKYQAWQKGEEKVRDATKDTSRAMNRLRAAKDTMDGRAGKVYRFGESNNDYFARPNEPVNILTIRDALTPVTEYFTHRIASAYPTGPIADLMGEEGLFGRLTDQLTNGDSRQAKGTLSAIARKMRTKAFSDVTGSEHLRDYVNYIRDEMTNITQKGNRHGSAVRAYQQAYDAAKSSMDKLTQLRSKTDAAAGEYWTALDKTPEARFTSLVRQHGKDIASGQIASRGEQAITLARQLYEGENLTTAIDAINSTMTEMLDRLAASTRDEQLRDLIGSAGFQTVKDNAIHDWRALSDAGYNPVWLHEPDAEVQARSTAGRITPFTSHYLTPSYERAKMFNWANGKMDIAVGVTDAVMQQFRTEAANSFVSWLVDNGGAVTSAHDLEAELRQSMAAAHPNDPVGLNAAIQQQINRRTEPFDPSAYAPGFKSRLTQGDHYVIDKTVAGGFRRLMKDDGQGLTAFAPYNRTMQLFRLSVLTGPRHLVHVTLGGLVQLLGQEPGALSEARNAFDALRSGELPEAVTQGLNEDNPDVLWQAATGKWMGNQFMQSLGSRLGSAEHALTSFESFTADWQRAMVYLDQLKHGASSEDAIAAVYKTFVNLDSLTPFERSVIRQAFPFWTYTKHALSYVLAYPIDHPIRAAILTSMYNQMTADQASGIPGKLSNLFFMGSPDAAGNVSTVDFKNLNPFRSIGGIGTLAGFLQGANPAIQLLARGLGIDPISGVPMIYQPLTYNAFTGSDEPTRPGIGAGDVAETIVPEVGVLDHFIGFTGQMRALKSYSPAGYRAALYNSLNLPFTYESQNIYDIRSKSEHARYEIAAQAVSEAESGNLSALDGFTYVPFQGYLLPAATVKAYIAQYSHTPGVVAKAVIPTPRRSKVKRVL